MKSPALILAASALLGCPVQCTATLYTDLNSTNPVAPYTNWSTAALTIQDAVDAALPGDVIRVTNGIYATGGRAIYGLTNRVVINKPVTIQSVNGPEFTIIQGYLDLDTGTGQNSVRCVLLDGAAKLLGFTLRGGGTRQDSGFDVDWLASGGGGVHTSSGYLSNCVLIGNSAYTGGGGAYGGTLSVCVLSNNSTLGPSSLGGGAYGATLDSCLVLHNLGVQGGGVADGAAQDCLIAENNASLGGAFWGVTSKNCRIQANYADIDGGGAYASTLSGCILTSNYTGIASCGGGAYACNLSACTLSNNSATYGGGVSETTADSCLLFNNSAASGGGASVDPYIDPTPRNVLRNCTITSNSAQLLGGGANGVLLENSIIFYNEAPTDPNCSATTNLYCCTVPIPTNGANNIASPPGFVDISNSDFRLGSNSPCINAGANTYSHGAADLDGNPRVTGAAVDLGAFEYQSTHSPFQSWLASYGLPIDGSADYLDSDGDGMNNWQEWRCHTDPTDPLSVLRLLPPSLVGADLAVSWQSVAGVTYVLERSTNLLAVPAFLSVGPTIPGRSGLTTYVDPSPPSLNAVYYRVGIAN